MLQEFVKTAAAKDEKFLDEYFQDASKNAQDAYKEFKLCSANNRMTFVKALAEMLAD